MKKTILLASAFCIVFLIAFAPCPGAFALLYDEKGNPLPEVPEESPYDAILQQMLSGEPPTSGDALPDDIASPDVVSVDTAGDSALDELMKTLRGGEPEPEDFGGFGAPDVPLFDGTPWGLEGRWVVVQEGSGNLTPGKISRVRLAALRKSDNLLDRALVLEISPSGEDPFLIRLADDVKGFEAAFSLQNFTAVDSSEIVLSIKSGARGTVRYLIAKAANRKGEILYDSDILKIPTIRGQFFDDYRAEIVVMETDAHILIDLFSRKQLYDDNRIYNDITGALRTTVRTRIAGVEQLQFVDVDNDGICELKSVLELCGANRADRIAWIDATLKYGGGKWNLLDCWVAPAEDLNQLPLPRRVN